MLSCVACGEDGLLPSTVDRGGDFAIAEIVYDQNYFYCVVEPVLFQASCGPGEAGDGNGCHFNRTSYRLSDYAPRVADSCEGLQPQVFPPPEAQQNYQASQARMNRDPALAPLLLRPTGKAEHPRVIFGEDSAEADLIRQWATRFSTQ